MAEVPKSGVKQQWSLILFTLRADLYQGERGKFKRVDGGQRVGFRYGHPDIFDRIFHITGGGISKASKVINLSVDIFAGFVGTCLV
ncbi:hypothetical protein Lal_00032257 [Lupinus albus]|nr:hypothetical protein Lal_00032257 [Lupinus albus]